MMRLMLACLLLFAGCSWDHDDEPFIEPDGRGGPLCGPACPDVDAGVNCDAADASVEPDAEQACRSECAEGCFCPHDGSCPCPPRGSCPLCPACSGCDGVTDGGN